MSHLVVGLNEERSDGSEDLHVDLSPMRQVSSDMKNCVFSPFNMGDKVFHVP